jgi:hypothetical protein
MVHVYSSSNTTLPIGRVADYNNTNPSRAVKMYRTLSTGTNLGAAYFPKQTQSDFARLIYGNRPYSLLHPNVTSDTLAKNTDYIA